MKKIFTLLTLTVLIGSAAMAQDNRHAQYRDLSPNYQGDNSRNYSNSYENQGGYQNSDKSYRQDRGNGYGYNNEGRHEKEEIAGLIVTTTLCMVTVEWKAKDTVATGVMPGFLLFLENAGINQL